MTQTKKVQTFELRSTNPAFPERDPYVMCTGTVRDCAAHAALEVHRKDESIPELELDVLEVRLRKHKTYVFRDRTFTIVPIIEEYDKDEDDE